MQNLDLTVVYYTANVISQKFFGHTFSTLLVAIKDLPLITVSHKPMIVSEITNHQNIVVDLERSHRNIYRQALEGAKAAKTKYIALCEDDVLYTQDHFKFRPSRGVFAYNMSTWSIYTWTKQPMFSYKDRRNLSQLICERDLFIEAMEERFAKYPTEEGLFLGNWAEPGKYEDNLGVTERKTQEFYSDPPNILFSHQTALSFAGLGTRKKLGFLRAFDIPYWGRADNIVKMYE